MQTRADTMQTRGQQAAESIDAAESRPSAGDQAEDGAWTLVDGPTPERNLHSKRISREMWCPNNPERCIHLSLFPPPTRARMGATHTHGGGATHAHACLMAARRHRQQHGRAWRRTLPSLQLQARRVL